MEFKLNNDLWRHNELWQINRNHWLEIFRGGFWSRFFFPGGLCPPDFFSAYSTDQNEPLWRKKSAPLKKKKRPSEEKKAPPWKVSPLINLPLLLKNVTGTQCVTVYISKLTVTKIGNKRCHFNSSAVEHYLLGKQMPKLMLALSSCLKQLPSLQQAPCFFATEVFIKIIIFTIKDNFPFL